MTPSPYECTAGPSRTPLVEGLAHEGDAEGGWEVTPSPYECTAGPKGQRAALVSRLMTSCRGTLDAECAWSATLRQLGV